MAEILKRAQIDYRANLPKIIDPSQEDSFHLGRENDDKFVRAILAVHRSLEPGKALVLRLAVAKKDETYGDLERYRGFVKDASVNFIYSLEDCFEGDRFIKFMADFDIHDFPPLVEMVIPANVYLNEDLGENTSASRAALFSGQIRQYLDSSDSGTTYLAVNTAGIFLSSKFYFHPSLIRDLHIEDIPQVEGKTQQVVFRKVTE